MLSQANPKELHGQVSYPRLREAFSLDAHAAPEEKEMIAMQAVSELLLSNPN